MFENHIPIISLITFLPLAGALLIAFCAWVGKADGREQLARMVPWAALLISGTVFLLSVLLVFDFDSSKAG